MYFSAEEQQTGKPRRNISQLSARKSRSIEIKAKDDKKDCYIFGMAVTNNGTILLADGKNSNIKSVSPDNKVLSILALSWSPRAITVLFTTTAVAASERRSLYIINITDTKALSLRSESQQLDYRINAMVAYNGNLAVTCETRPDETIKLITIHGMVLWSVCVRGIKGEGLLHCPFAAVFVVSDYMKNTLTLLETETGKIIRSIDVGEEKGPYGITVDSDGNAYVCDRRNYEIGVWSADFKESKILLSRDKLGAGPCYIVYSAVNDSLYVSYPQTSRSCNTVDIFRLV